MNNFLTVGKLLDKLSKVNPEAKVLMLVPYGHPTYTDSMFCEVEDGKPADTVLLVGTIELGREPSQE